MKRALLCLFLLLSFACLSAQTAEEYDPGEVSTVLFTVMRPAIIFAGAFPFAVLLSSLVATQFIPDSAWNGMYKDYGKGAGMGSFKVRAILFAAIIASGVVALTDFIIESVRLGKAHAQKKADAERERKERESYFSPAELDKGVSVSEVFVHSGPVRG